MFVQISKEEFVNLAKVAYVKISGGYDVEGESYLFYNSSKELIAQTEFGSLFNHDVKKAIEKLTEY